MARFTIPYGRTGLTIDLPDARLQAMLAPSHTQVDAPDEAAIVREALTAPIQSARLCELSRGVQRVLVLTSDHTRPVPSHITLPAMLAEIREGNPAADIRILVATGCHRATTQVELTAKFGADIVQNEDIRMHIATDDAAMTSKGTLPSGGALRVNALVDWAELVVADGFIEPHFFAGFSGGRKSVLPGIASLQTVMGNHCARFIADPHARAGVLEGNPLHVDMLHAARVAGLRFILNVAIDEQKRVIAAWAGDFEQAHLRGTAWVGARARVEATPADIVVVTNGGYPLDQNIYQAVKGMTAAEACVREGGVIIMCAACEDGHGGEGFYEMVKEAVSPQALWERILQVPQEETCADQWEAQVLARVLCRAQVILVSDQCDPALIENMHMRHAGTFEEALRMADAQCPGGRIVLIPDGVSVIVG